MLRTRRSVAMVLVNQPSREAKVKGNLKRRGKGSRHRRHGRLGKK
eukprot:COSAG06_NODE_18577_length_880_cov_0.773367_2_plen_44_part_01